MIYNYHGRGSKIKRKSKTNTCFLFTNKQLLCSEKNIIKQSAIFTYIVWINNLNKKKLLHYLNISISRTLFCLPLISCLFTEALSVNELIIREKIQIFLTWTVLSILLVLRMEIMDCVGHDVPWVHGFLKIYLKIFKTFFKSIFLLFSLLDSAPT